MRQNRPFYKTTHHNMTKIGPSVRLSDHKLVRNTQFYQAAHPRGQDYDDEKKSPSLKILLYLNMEGHSGLTNYRDEDGTGVVCLITA